MLNPPRTGPWALLKGCHLPGAQTAGQATGYHHHVGLNSWMGEGAPPAPPDSRGLRHFSIDLPDTAELDGAAARIRAAEVPAESTEAGLVLRDPSQNGILLTATAR